jgi:lipopolysaccharide cholinephosphotransferase
VVDYRDGRPSPDLIRLQQVEKSLLARLAEYCERHGIEWFLTAGSALGAIRHGDFIPWDDDIDVGIVREDYERLCDLMRRDPLPGTFLQNWKSEPGFVLPCSILRLNGTFVADSSAYEGLHRGISIDIFPYDRLPRSRAAGSFQRMMIGLFNLMIIPWPYEPQRGWRFALRRFARLVARTIAAALPARLLLRARDCFARMDFAPKGDMLNSHGMYGVMQYRRSMVPVAETLPTTEGTFGALKVRLPANPEAFLRRLFGDFMKLPPEDQRRPLHVGKVQFELEEGRAGEGPPLDARPMH